MPGPHSGGTHFRDALLTGAREDDGAAAAMLPLGGGEDDGAVVTTLPLGAREDDGAAAAMLTLGAREGDGIVIMGDVLNG
jgi:hypothetical protein